MRLQLSSIMRTNSAKFSSCVLFSGVKMAVTHRGDFSDLFRISSTQSGASCPVIYISCPHIHDDESRISRQFVHTCEHDSVVWSRCSFSTVLSVALSTNICHFKSSFRFILTRVIARAGERMEQGWKML